MSRLIMIGGQRAITASYTGLSAYTSGSSSHSILTSYGTAQAGRKIIHAVHVIANAGVTPTLTSATIGGVTATTLESVLRVTGGQLTLGVFWLGAENTSGTSGNLAVAFSATVGVQIGTWRAINVQSLTAAYDSDETTFNSESSATKDLSVNTKSGGLVLAASTLQHDGADPSLTAGVNEDYSGLGSGAFRMTGGHDLASATQLDRTVTLTRTTGANWQGAFSAISIR